MSEIYVIGILFGLVQAAFFLWVKTSITTMEKLAADVVKMQLLVANEYVKKSELKDHLVRIEQTLDELKSYLMPKQKL